jgi:hypothetical protein
MLFSVIAPARGQKGQSTLKRFSRSNFNHRPKVAPLKAPVPNRFKKASRHMECPLDQEPSFAGCLHDHGRCCSTDISNWESGEGRRGNEQRTSLPLVIQSWPTSSIWIRDEIIRNGISANLASVIDGAGPRIRNGAAKGGRSRIVPLWWDAGTLEGLTAWKGDRLRAGAAHDEPLLASLIPGRKVKAFSRHTLRKRFRIACRVLGADRLETLTIHHGRHTFISHALIAVLPLSPTMTTFESSGLTAKARIAPTELLNR